MKNKIILEVKMCRISIMIHCVLIKYMKTLMNNTIDLMVQMAYNDR